VEAREQTREERAGRKIQTTVAAVASLRHFPRNFDIDITHDKESVIFL